jgi:hypothetical protein
MTDAEIISTGIGALGLLVAGGSTAVAMLALRRTEEAEKREREAVIVIRNVWSGTPGIDDFHIPPSRGKPAQWFHRNKPPAEAEQQLVIAMESRDRSVLVRQSDEDVILELRTATPNDLADQDGPGGRNTHYVLLEISNIGRWAATDVRITCMIDGLFLEEFGQGTVARTFPEQMIWFESLAPNQPRYVRIRNMTGLPVALDGFAVSVDNDQPIRMAPWSAINFQPRGYRS